MAVPLYARWVPTKEPRITLNAVAQLERDSSSKRRRLEDARIPSLLQKEASTNSKLDSGGKRKKKGTVHEDTAHQKPRHLPSRDVKRDVSPEPPVKLYRNDRSGLQEGQNVPLDAKGDISRRTDQRGAMDELKTRPQVSTDIPQGSSMKKVKGKQITDLDAEVDGPDAVASTKGSNITPGEAYQLKHGLVLSKFHKSAMMAESVSKTASGDAKISEDTNQASDRETVHGLQPLPQPAPLADFETKAGPLVLPQWLANPLIVSAREHTAFEALNLHPKLVETLQRRGYQNAFAIQSAVLPLLLPGEKHELGDLCISGATGSGKTLAYLLPMIESLTNRVMTRLRGLIIVPTRELVLQVKETCEMCASGFGLKIGIGVGNRSLEHEKALLIRSEQRYEPDLFRKSRLQALERDEVEQAREPIDLEGTNELLPDHVVEFVSSVDILVCTPGRLVEHLRSTPGFTLSNLEWLVMDEADRLLGQSFQGWAEILMKRLQTEDSHRHSSAIRGILQTMAHQRPGERVRKVVVSATMTNDVGKLTALRLKKPKLVLVEHSQVAQRSMHSSPSLENTGTTGTEGVGINTFELPHSLDEWAVAAGEGGDKPLYLWQLLMTRLLPSGIPTEAGTTSKSISIPKISKFNIRGLPISTDEDSDVNGSSSSADSEADKSTSGKSKKVSVPARSDDNPRQTTQGVLVFTKSNEAAVRLTRLLSLLQPSLSSMIGTLTSNVPTSERRRTLKGFSNNRLSILVASDLVARGMDISNLAHVVNYDLPSTERSYVHRVGRTARAERAGEAWSLVADKEARWFWREIGRGDVIRRVKGKKVRRLALDIKDIDEAIKDRYDVALAELEKEVRSTV